jgi:predicted transposase YdaD
MSISHFLSIIVEKSVLKKGKGKMKKRKKGTKEGRKEGKEEGRMEIRKNSLHFIEMTVSEIQRRQEGNT